MKGLTAVKTRKVFNILAIVSLAVSGLLLPSATRADIGTDFANAFLNGSGLVPIGAGFTGMGDTLPIGGVVLRVSPATTNSFVQFWAYVPQQATYAYNFTFASDLPSNGDQSTFALLIDGQNQAHLPDGTPIGCVAKMVRCGSSIFSSLALNDG